MTRGYSGRSKSYFKSNIYQILKVIAYLDQFEFYINDLNNMTYINFSPKLPVLPHCNSAVVFKVKFC